MKLRKFLIRVMVMCCIPDTGSIKYRWVAYGRSGTNLPELREEVNQTMRLEK